MEEYTLKCEICGDNVSALCGIDACKKCTAQVRALHSEIECRTQDCFFCKDNNCIKDEPQCARRLVLANGIL